MNISFFQKTDIPTELTSRLFRMSWRSCQSILVSALCWYLFCPRTALILGRGQLTPSHCLLLYGLQAWNSFQFFEALRKKIERRIIFRNLGKFYEIQVLVSVKFYWLTASFIYILSVTSFTSHWQSWGIAKETIRSMKVNVHVLCGHL